MNTKKKASPIKTLLVSAIAVVLLLFGSVTGLFSGDQPIAPEAATAAPKATQAAALDAATAVPEATRAAAPEATQAAALIEPQAIADYLFAHGELPDNFITKAEARALGWDSAKNYVSDVAPGKSIGGDRFGNYEGLLPKAAGRQYYEADCNYVSGPRGAERIIYSSDGLVFYTGDHYKSFSELSPSK